MLVCPPPPPPPAIQVQLCRSSNSSPSLSYACFFLSRPGDRLFTAVFRLQTLVLDRRKFRTETEHSSPGADLAHYFSPYTVYCIRIRTAAGRRLRAPTEIGWPRLSTGTAKRQTAASRHGMHARWQDPNHLGWGPLLSLVLTRFRGHTTPACLATRNSKLKN